MSHYEIVKAFDEELRHFKWKYLRLCWGVGCHLGAARSPDDAELSPQPKSFPAGERKTSIRNLCLWCYFIVILWRNWMRLVLFQYLHLWEFLVTCDWFCWKINDRSQNTCLVTSGPELTEHQLDSGIRLITLFSKWIQLLPWSSVPVMSAPAGPVSDISH